MISLDSIYFLRESRLDARQSIYLATFFDFSIRNIMCKRQRQSCSRRRVALVARYLIPLALRLEIAITLTNTSSVSNRDLSDRCT